jgi:hypothetical protein
VIERNNISDVVYHEKKYYHEDCFCELCNKRIASKRGNPVAWQEALDSLWVLEAETKKMLEHYWAKDDLNNWLLEHYDISMVPSYFWQLVSDLENGKYKNRKCKPVGIEMIYGCWKWGQKRLDKISANNKSNHKGPKNDTDRLRYDLAIVIQHIGDYKKHIAKEETQRAEIIKTIKQQPTIDYASLNKNTENKSDDDIFDMNTLIDEIF